MAEKKKLLEVRKERKSQKYDFVVKESKFSARVKSRWRFPRGKHSKVRQMHRGRPVMPSPGFGSPKEVKNLHSSGLRFNVINNVSNLNGLDNKEDGIVISSTIGKRKKLSLIKIILDKGFKIINIKNPNKLVEDIKSELEERKNKRSEASKDKKKKLESRKKKAEKKEKEDKSNKEESNESKGGKVKKNLEEELDHNLDKKDDQKSKEIKPEVKEVTKEVVKAIVKEKEGNIDQK